MSRFTFRYNPPVRNTEKETQEQFEQYCALQQQSIKNSIRQERTKLLAESDWTQFVDSPLTQEQKQLWAVYRQQLRDLLENNPLDFSSSFVIDESYFPSKPQQS